MAFRFKSKEDQLADIAQLEILKRVNTEEYFAALTSLNKLGIKDSAELDKAERTISGAKAIRAGVDVSGRFDFEHLKAIHKYLFGDIYYFSGQTRTMDMELDSITKFCKAAWIDRKANFIFDDLKKDNFLQGLEKPAFIEKLANYMTDVNMLHPFREGNGRSKRLFFTELTKQAGFILNFSTVAAKEWIIADEIAFDSSSDSSQQRNTDYLKILLDKAIKPLNSIDTLVLVQPLRVLDKTIISNNEECYVGKIPGKTPQEPKQLVTLPKNECKIKIEGGVNYIISATPALIKRTNCFLARTQTNRNVFK